MFKQHNLQFLKETLGKFDEEYQYPRISLIEGPLFYIEKETKKELEKEIEIIKKDETKRPTYIWGYVKETQAIYVTRTFGENKVFIYNPNWSNKTDYVKGKQQVLDNLKIETIDDLFEQKAVFEYFYKKLWKLRLDLAREIRDKNGITDNFALMEAQHIIDRIIFTYFICEKGIITEKSYGTVTGDDLFSGLIGQLDEIESWEYLKKLFFEQFAKSNSGDLDCGGDAFIKTPYLNGGLFRPKTIQGISEENIRIEFDWNKIFEPLNKYTWIIEDEIPDFQDDYEGNLTPEIIGHIYEKFVISLEQLGEIKFEDLDITDEGDLKKGNKKIGAYYTPENITGFISKETITLCLLNKLEINDDNSSFEDLIENFDFDMLKASLSVLNEIRICDPSCGSGAFLLKAGEILLEYKTKILTSLNLPINSYALKKDIIINNLYGVDLQRGAVEICKLRLWLWLISSAPNANVEPLPNIEYNFLVGNSLVGWTNENLNQNMLFEVNEKDIRPLISLKIGYEPEQRNKIDEAINLLNKKDVNSYAKALNSLKTLYSYSEGENAEILKITIEWIRETIYEKTNRIFNDFMENKGVKIDYDELTQINPFHWNVDFNEIFSDGGFDVVIGNPPYGNILNKYEKKWIKKTYSCNKARNIAENFFERTLDLLIKKNHFMGYVIPKTISFYGSWEEIRQKILKNNLRDTFDVGIGFVGVNYEEIVLIVENKKFEKMDVNIFSCDNLKSPYKGKKPIYLGKTPQQNMNEANTIIFRPINDTEQNIINEIDKNSVRFNEIYDEKAFRGLYISNKEKEKFRSGSVKWINKVPDVKRYYIDKYMEISLEDKWEKKAKKILKPRLFFKVLRGKRLVCYADLKGEFLTTEKLVNVIINPDNYNLKTLMLIINSYLPSFYIQKVLFSETTETSRVMDDMYAKTIPIPKSQGNEEVFNRLYDFMIFLNSTEELRESQNNKISFIDKLIDCVVYELYLKQKLKTDLIKKINVVLDDFDKGIQDNGESVENFINKIQEESIIMGEIEKIKNHEWVKLIENK